MKIKNIRLISDPNNIECRVVDGNNLLEVTQATENLVSNIRKSKCPAFIEAITYRHYGHVDWREDSDVGVNRSKVEIDLWKKRDPIHRLRKAMIEKKITRYCYYRNQKNYICNSINM